MNRNIATVLGQVLLVCSLVANIVLAWQPAKAALRNTQRRFAPVDGSLEPGAIVPPLKAVDLSGRVRVVTFDALPTVFYVFTPSCRFCILNLEGVKSLAHQASGRFRVIGISLTNEFPADYVRVNALPFEVLYRPDDSTKKDYRMGTTPSTIIVNARGGVVRSFDGTYNGPTRRAMQNLLKVTLPEAQTWSHSQR